MVIMDELFMTFEKRFLKMGNYKSCEYRYFEKYMYLESLTIYYKNNKECVDFFNFPYKFYNYELCMFSIYDLLRIKLRKCYNYVLLIDKGANDSWSYYYLNKVENGKKYWKLDSRLDRLSITLELVCNYCSTLFKGVYKQLYGNNNKRNFADDSYLLSEDLKTLYENIEILASRKNCSTLLRNNMKSVLNYELKSTDIIDRHEDDIDVIGDYNAISKEDIDKEINMEIKRLYFV